MFPRPLPRADLVWLTFLGVPSLIDWLADQGEPDGDTFTECTRRLFHTHTPIGRVVFTATLAVGATWLHRHITKETA